MAENNESDANVLADKQQQKQQLMCTTWNAIHIIIYDLSFANHTYNLALRIKSVPWIVFFISLLSWYVEYY